MGALPLAAAAGESPGLGVQDVKGAAQVGGVSTIDYVTLRAGNLGAPLRFGHVFQGSEQVQLGGRTLQAGTDYGIDYETGVIYLKRAQRNGDQMVVSYRYDPQGKVAAGTSFTGVNKFGLSLAPGLGFIGGLGLTERAADGSVMSSNVFGWNNTLKFGGNTSLGGLYLYSDRKKNDNVAGLSMDPNAKPGDAGTEEGASQFLLQNFRSALFGGNVSVDYQEISKNFSSAGQVRAAGYSDADVARLMKERGLKRQGMSLTGMRFGASTIGASFKQVGDKNGGIDWSSYSFAQGGLKMSMNSQRVDSKFTRFGDLAEADRAQLQKEAGMSRQNLAMEFGQKAGKFSFTSTAISDDKNDNGLIRREAKLDTGKIGLTFGEQEVDKKFGRIASLTGAEQAMWGREVGAKRQWAGLTAALGGASGGKLAFSQLGLETASGRYFAQEGSYESKTWSLQHVRMGGSGKAVPMNALQDAEGNAAVKRIAGFFGNAGTNDSHRAQFLGAGNMKRDLTSVKGDFGKGMKLEADSLKFGEGGEKGGAAESVSISTSTIKASFKHQDFGQKFTDASRLMEFERAKLGTVAGLQRTDISFGIQIDKTRSFQFGRTTAQTAEGDLDRTSLAYNAKGLQISANQRSVSSGFAVAASLVDPENTLLAQFRGYQERDLGINYSGTPGLKVQAFIQDAVNKDTKEARSVATTNVDWRPDKLTGITYTSQMVKSSDPLTKLFSQSLERVALTRNLAGFGNLKLVDERVNYEGKDAKQADMHKTYVGLEANLTKTTSVRTEQTRTSYDDGNKENISANTVSTALSRNVGVSVTDVTVDRKGSDNDEKKRNYGFWYDLGKGLRLSYGYAQSLVGDNKGTGVETMSFGQTPNTLAPNQVGQVGQSNVGGVLMGGGYGENTFLSADGTRTQSFANFGLQTAKPLRFGSITDIKFNFGLDTAADYSQFLRQNQVAGISGRLGKNVFAFSYRSQLANVNPNPAAGSASDPVEAIDRSFSLSTDPDPKAKVVVNGSVKFRTLPKDQEYMSRNVAVTARPLPGVELTNVVQTNLEQANPNVILGSQLLADRGNKWVLGFKGNGDTSFGAAWEEKLNDSTKASSTLSSVYLTLFQKSGSPLKLTYGVDEVEGNVAHRQITRYSLQYDMRPTALRNFSLFLGNVGYAYNVDNDLKGDNWTLRMNYQIRF
ncbi:hypothetical protein EON82_13355 [bacterium]|nr:MAG: hypothetical protein EON82_13355 [bacterium]